MKRGKIRVFVAGALVTLLTTACSPRTAPSPAPIPGPVSLQTPTEIKYLLVDNLGEPFFCDPDYYPVARADETDLALTWFAEVGQSGEEFQGILRQHDLPDASYLSVDEKLLIYREHKKLSAIALGPMGETYRFELRISEGETGFLIEGKIDRAGQIEIEKKEPSFNTCPICLAGETLIDTPHGPVAVKDLRVGMVVWTSDGSGARIPASVVVRVERVEWQGTGTYDILPSGGTGLYWANGVLVRSTLARDRAR